MLFKSLTVIATALSLAQAAPSASNHVLHERRSASPSAWEKIDTLDARTTLPMRIGLTQSNLEAGRDALIEK